MKASNDFLVRAWLWHSEGFTDAVQGRFSLHSLLIATGDHDAADAYAEGWREGLQRMAAGTVRK
jgi:hypothetical protein